MGLLTVAKVAVENTAYSFDMLFDYSVPDYLYNDVLPGKRVLVKFGNSSKMRVGIVFSVSKGVISSKNLKNISLVIDDEPLLTYEMLKTANFVRDRYFCTYYDACKLFLPLFSPHLEALIEPHFARLEPFSAPRAALRECRETQSPTLKISVDYLLSVNITILSYSATILVCCTNDVSCTCYVLI